MSIIVVFGQKNPLFCYWNLSPSIMHLVGGGRASPIWLNLYLRDNVMQAILIKKICMQNHLWNLLQKKICTPSWIRLLTNWSKIYIIKLSFCPLATPNWVMFITCEQLYFSNFSLVRGTYLKKSSGDPLMVFLFLEGIHSYL